jgi:integrase
MSKKSSRSPRRSKSGSGPKHFRPEKPTHWRIVNGKPTGEVFPLTPLCNGAWAKKIDGTLKYYGSWATRVDGKLVQKPGDDWWKPALALYESPMPQPKAGETTVRVLCNHFLTARLRKCEAGEMSQRQYDEYKAITDLLVERWRDRLVDDLGCTDFASLRAEMAKRWGPVRLTNSIIRVRSVFKFAFSSKLSKIHPDQRYGDEFSIPSARTMRKNRNTNGHRILEAADVRKMLDAARPDLKAMILLGVNSGFGNHDVATLPLSALDLDGGWVTYPRPKTEVDRRCPLWPETVAALRAAIAERPEPKQDAARDCVFVTARGRQWLSGGVAFPVVASTTALMKDVGVHRKGLGFYTLRHCFRTHADATKDPVAIHLIMGHTDGSIDANYRHGIYDDRLRVVTEAVRTWLFAPAAEAGGE